MSNPTLCVIVPVYKAAATLDRCVASVLAQQVTGGLRCILVDDGSPDESGGLCDAWAARDPRVTVLHQENRGVSAARNAGIDAAKGRYYSFIDSDDVVLPRFLQTLYDACEEHDAYMSLCSVEDVQEDGKSCDLRKLMALMGMGVKQGDTVTVKVEGDDEAAAAEAIQKFLTENV